jgi:hypothetical protein
MVKRSAFHEVRSEFLKVISTCFFFKVLSKDSFLKNAVRRLPYQSSSIVYVYVCIYICECIGPVAPSGT